MKSGQWCVVVLGLVVGACGGGSDGGGPTGPSATPTPPTTSTKVIRLEGSLEFGDVGVGEGAERQLTIHNEGTGAMQVSGMTGIGGYTASWTNGTIPAGGRQVVTVFFRPTESRTYNGELVVNGDITSGARSTPLRGRGLLPLFVQTGSGNAVFTIPSHVQRVRVFARWNGRNNSNFIVRRNGISFINAILRDTGTYEGVHLVTGGGTVETVSSENISEWRFTEER